MAPSSVFRAALVATLLLVGFAPLAVGQRQSIGQLGWTPYRDSKLGYLFVFPAKTFAAQAGDPTEQLQARTSRRSGQVFRSKDAKAFLQIAAFANFERLSVGAYKARVVSSYKDASIDYERIADGFFVVSGVRGKQTFYERVYFTCGGRMISAWSMNYPEAEADLYDRIVEEFARNFRPAETPQACS